MKLVDIAEKLAETQIKHPWKFIIFGALVTIVAGVTATGLKFDSSYEALLPKDTPQVENADDVRARTGGTRQLVVAIGGENPDARLEFGKKLLNKIQKIDGVRTADLEFPVDFFKDRGLWLSDLETLDKLIPALENAVHIAKVQANPLALHLDEEEEKRELDEAWQKVDDTISEKRGDLPFEGVLTSEDGKYTFLLVIPSIKFSDMDAGRVFLKNIESAVAELSPESNGLKIRYAGNLKVIQEQHVTMSKDLRFASIIALGFGVLIVAVFTRRPTAPFVIGTALVAGVTWTFAMARVFIGHVNIITGFLAAVLIGLGIDFGIHLFVRYQQEASQPGVTTEQAVKNFVVGTAAPALTSALTTACVFFSFTIADFRGFSEFGLIAGTGVIFTLLSSFLILPPVLYLRYRNLKPIVADTKAFSPAKPPAPLSRKAAIASVVVLGICAVYGTINVGKIPFRNNFKQLRGYSEATEFFEYVDNNLGAGFNPAVFLSSNPSSASKIADLAKVHKDMKHPDGGLSKIGKIVSISDFLPSEIEEHGKRVKKLDDILWDPKLDKAASKEGHRAEKLIEARRMVKTEPWLVKDLPEVVRKRFMSLDGKEYITYVWPKERNDADYQAAAWEDELNKLSGSLKKAGIDHDMADETLIVAWIYRLIKSDGLPLLVAAVAVVFILLLIDFRSFKDALLVIFPLSVGMMSFLGAMHLWGLELNMFNMVVVPSVIGIGIDNAVHIFHRYKHEGRGSISLVIRTTGVAAFLASLTTAVGFGSSMVSHNVGLQTLGSLAVVGIAATFLSAAVFFPGLITLLEGLKKRT